jgi:hypothetical protein
MVNLQAGGSNMLLYVLIIASASVSTNFNILLQQFAMLATLTEFSLQHSVGNVGNNWTTVLHA